MFCDLPDRPEGSSRIVDGEDFLESEGCPAAEGVAAAQQEHAVGPGLVDGPVAAALDLLGGILPGLSHCLVGEGDQVEVIDCDCGAGKPHPQRFPERRGGVDRHDLHCQPPFQRPGEQPVTDALVVSAVDHARDLTGVQVNNGCHPGFEPGPSLR